MVSVSTPPRRLSTAVDAFVARRVRLAGAVNRFNGSREFDRFDGGPP
jgi:hypothetical protein